MTHQVSVIVAVWNASHTLRACVESVMSQEGVIVELILINDCSTDETQALICQLAAQYVDIVQARTSHNSGPSAARNLGLQLASKEWIAIIDADDTIAPNRLYQLIEVARENSADICFDNLKIIQTPQASRYEKGTFLIPAGLAFLLRGPWTVESYTSLNRPYSSPVLIGFLKPLIRRDFIQATRLRYNEEVSNSEDYLLILESIICGARIRYFDSALYHYFVYKSSLSGQFNPVAHRKLIIAEQALLATYQGVLTKQQTEAIQWHLHSLYLAEVTNELFAALRGKMFALFIKKLWADRPNIASHVSRIGKSFLHKAFGFSNRGS